MEIRKFRPVDAAEVSEVICRALALINIKDYPEDNIKPLIVYFSPETILKLAQARHMLVATIDSKIVGTGSLYEDTIYSLFVDPDHITKGIGRKLMQKLEELAKNNHIALLKVPSSLTAIEFYIKLGFVKEKEILNPKSGRTIHMTKNL
jgi:ribosomal protein S18 acetylase RimI-like enzyme